MTDLSQRAMALAVADRIADVFLDLLSHVHSSPPDHTVEVHLYWLFVFSFIHSVLNGGIFFSVLLLISKALILDNHHSRNPYRLCS